MIGFSLGKKHDPRKRLNLKKIQIKYKCIRAACNEMQMKTAMKFGQQTHGDPVYNMCLNSLPQNVATQRWNNHWTDQKTAHASKAMGFASFVFW